MQARACIADEKLNTDLGSEAGSSMKAYATNLEAE